MTKKFLLFGTAFLSFLLLTLYACRNDLEGIKTTQNEHPKNKFVSFQKFLQITKFNKSDILQNYHVSAKLSPDDFIIDTIKIRQTLSNGNISAFSFLVYPKNYNEESETKDIFYNLAYVKKNNVWTKSIFKFTSEKGWLELANLNPSTSFNGTIQLIYPSTTTARTYICGYTASPYFYCWAGHTDPNDGDCGDCWNFHITYIFCNDDGNSGSGSGSDDGSSGGGGNGGTGFDANLPTITGNPDCDKAANATVSANILINYINVKPKLDTLANFAITKSIEYGVTISKQIGDNYPIASDPYTQNYAGQVIIYAPTNGDYIANAHSHSEGGSPPPSPADFYAAMGNAVNYTTFSTSFIYASDGSVYAIMVNNRQNAQNFLANYPRSTNLSANGKEIIGNSTMAIKFNEILNGFVQGRFPNYSGNSQKDGLETALAWVLNKYNSGMSIAKMDDNGNFKALTAKSFNHYDAAGQQNVTAYKTETCP